MKDKILVALKKWGTRFIMSLGTIFLFFIIMSFISLSTIMSGRDVSLPDDMILRVVVDGGFNEIADNNPFAGLTKEASYSIHSLTQSIRKAAADERVKGMVISVKDGQYGYAHINEVHQALEVFKNSGKKIYSYGTSFGGVSSGMAPYYMASISDEIWMQPLSSLSITGFYMQTPFFKRLLGKFGVQPDILHKGDYKSAPESIMRNNMSKANRSMSTSLLNDYYEGYVSGISRNRKLDTAKVKAAIDNAPLLGEEAVSQGFIDRLGYKDQFIDYIEEKIGDFEWVDVGMYSQENRRASDKGYVAVVVVNGVIADNPAQGKVMGEDTIDLKSLTRDIQAAKDDKNCIGIVVRINSPGGTPEASEELRRTIVMANEEKPVVVSMGNVAASGGYWIAVNSRKIIAQPMTLTGSIGVFGGKIAFAEMLQKIGVNVDAIKFGENADIWSLEKPYTSRQRKKMEQHLDQVYEAFVERVAFGRGMDIKTVHELAKGRVYTGNQALKVGLVDELGGVDVAISEIVPGDSSDEYEIRYFPKPANIFEKLLGVASSTGMTFSKVLTVLSFGNHNNTLLIDDIKIN